MWRTRLIRHLPAVSLRNCSSCQAKHPSPSLPPSKTSIWSKTEKLKRRRDREDAILSNKSIAPTDAAITWSEKQSTVYTGQTPPGEKKDTTLPLPPTYSPEYVESSWYEWWTKEGFFQPEKHAALPHAVNQTFSMCIPPPNVTGTLHLGHALTVAIEDSLVRWRRMKGHRVLWVPGCDHAGIATQTVVERRLLRDQGKRRRDLSREELLQEAWQWKEDKEESIYQQLRKLGASLDWSRTCFTLDPSFSAAVSEAFVRLCDSGLIYRSEALVNWSCALESAISDIEVEAKQLSGKTLLSVPGYDNQVEFGTLYTFAYPVDGLDEEVAVSTSRPETMLGDVAVAVHPDDPHYQALHGKQCRHPFTQRLLPIITDPAVDMDFGTGAVKVTPAHDHTDFQVSQRHSLPHLTVIGGDGTMTAQCGDWLLGVKRFDARHLVVNALIDKQLFRGTKSHAMTLPVCSRSGDIIEPLLKKQWFVRCEDMARRAIQAVEEEQLEIIPHFYTKTWKNWLDNISDWCISRQLWWGHQVPAYQVDLPSSVHQQDFGSERWVWGRSEDEARQRAAAKYGVDPADVTLTRDPDVLDTWFSSALFPFAMLGWPQQTADLQSFYPNSLLETGSDLIFFWVARMVMLGTELTGRLPFKQVLFHSLVRDKHGRKMSKSLGNVINPMDVIHGVSLERLQEAVREGNLEPREQSVALEAQRKDFPSGIPECGADALRFALCSSRLQGEDVSLSVSKVLTCRMFCNKMWQTLRFTLGLLAGNPVPLTTLAETRPVSRMDQWICSRLHGTVLQCEQAFQSYQLHAVTSCLHSFWLHCLCDVYLEYLKPLVAPQGDGVSCDGPELSVLFHCVSVSLALLSPIMPFISEELWQRLEPWRPAASAQDSLCLQPYPSSSQLAHWRFPEVERDFLLVREVIRVTRSLRAQAGITKDKPSMSAVCSPHQALVLPRFESAIQTLGRISSLHVHSCDGADALSAAPPAGSLVGVVDDTCQLHLHVPTGLNTNKQTQQLSRRRTKLVRKLEEELERVQSPERLPAHVKQRIDSKVSALQKELRTIDEQLRALSLSEHTQ